MQTSLLRSLLFLGLAGGCAGSGSASYSASVSAPEMVVISPGVQVIANYDEPIFYNDNYYWRNQGGVWYRSTSHTRGWVRYSAPRAIVSIERPSAYIRYRGSAQVNTRSDNRQDAKERREDAKEDRKDAKEDRKERAEDRREDRKDAAEDRRDDKKKHDKKHDKHD
ncbi:MAG: hypothetical protein H0V17_19110 [Deltaproteobacteria bacterium]|nr:hypothetical protein [Deltaproteobacteria bacterium]